MTATPTPLRELPPLPPMTCGPETGHVATYTAEQMRAYAEAALSARQEEGAVELRCTDPDNCRRCSEDADTPHAGIPRGTIATPPASGEAGAVCRVCDGGPGNNGVCLCGMREYATPAAASGDANTNAWCEAFDRDASEWGAHYLAGRLRLATNIIRRLAAVAPAGMTGTVADIPDCDLLRRAVGGTARRARRQPAWALVAEVFALGSTYAGQLCRRFNVDPDTGKPLPAPTPPATAGKE